MQRIVVAILLVFLCFDCAQKPEIITIEIKEIVEEPIIKKGDPGTEDNLYGFEGGTVIKQNNKYHLFTAEVCGEPKVVKTKLAYWTSEDGLNFSRISTLVESSGNFDSTDAKASLWSPMPIYNEKSDRWNMFYVAYRSAPNLPGRFSELTFRYNVAGKIIRSESIKEGKDGLEGPYKDINVVLQPGKNSDWWEGPQGTDSFYPFQVNDKWISFYGSWRSNVHWNNKLWFGVGLVESEKLEGPWERCSEYNPVLINPVFVENPVVMKYNKNWYLAVYDTGYEDNTIGYSLSKDGYKWSKEKLILFPDNVPSWRGETRTPLGIIHEEEDVFSIYYTAFSTNTFLPNEEPKHHSGYGTVGLIRVSIKTE